MISITNNSAFEKLSADKGGESGSAVDAALPNELNELRGEDTLSTIAPLALIRSLRKFIGLGDSKQESALIYKKDKLLYFRTMTFPGEEVPTSIKKFMLSCRSRRDSDWRSNLESVETTVKEEGAGLWVETEIQMLLDSLTPPPPSLDEVSRQKIKALLQNDSVFDLPRYESLALAVSSNLSGWARDHDSLHFCGSEAYSVLSNTLKRRICLGELGFVSKFQEFEFTPAVEAVRKGLKDIIVCQISGLLYPSFPSVSVSSDSIPKQLWKPLEGMVRINRDLGMSVNDVLSPALAESLRQLVKAHHAEIISTGIDESQIAGWIKLLTP
jgi:hypothetical protein